MHVVKVDILSVSTVLHNHQAIKDDEGSRGFLGSFFL